MSAEGTTDAAARAAEPPSATDPGVGGETTPPVTKLNSTEEVPAEKRARQPEEATGSGKTIVQPPEEVKARLAERQKKQRERAEAARAEAARRQAEEQAAAKEAASRGRDATPGDGERPEEKKAPAVSAVSEKDRLIARQKELAARRAAEKQASKRSPQTSALDANARFLAAAAARAAALKASGGAALSPTFASSAAGSASAAATPPAATDAARPHKKSPVPEVRSFEEVMAEKKRRETAVTDEARAAAAAAEAALVTKTIAVRTEDDQTVEISMKVHVPQERLAQLEARRAARDAAKREREAKEERARRDRLAMKTEEAREGKKEEEEEDGRGRAPVAATEKANPVPSDAKEQKPVPAKRAVEPEGPERPDVRETPEPAPKRGRAKKSDAPEAAAEAPPKRARRSTRK